MKLDALSVVDVAVVMRHLRRQQLFNAGREKKVPHILKTDLKQPRRECLLPETEYLF